MTSAQRARGLMFRRRAPQDGMLFVFRERRPGGFWMKNTLVPLTIVFFDSAGKRVRKLSMTPCRKDPCRDLRPGQAVPLRARAPRVGHPPRREARPARGAQAARRALPS